MGNKSPSHIRRQGRKAFEEGYLLDDNPYNDHFYFGCWEDGWKQAATEEADEEKEKRADEELYENIMSQIETDGPENTAVGNLVRLLIDKGILI